MKPTVQNHDGVYVVRDDRLGPGGSKTRFLPMLFMGADEVCYASSSCGAGQVGLAAVAKRLGKKATIFAAARIDKHSRQIEAMKLGAKYVWVKCGYQNVLNAHMRKYCEKTGARAAPFGLRFDGATDVIAQAAASISKSSPDYVWVSGGSGLLATGLHKAWGQAEHHVCQVGHQLTADEVGSPKTFIHEAEKPYGWAAPLDWVPFTSDAHYEAKTFHMMQAWRAKHKPKGSIIYWHACGAAQA